MSRDEIIAMATEAGFELADNATDEALNRFRAFAALVAAQKMEACAQVCDAKAHEVRLWCNESNVVACAAAIRERGES